MFCTIVARDQNRQAMVGGLQALAGTIPPDEFQILCNLADISDPVSDPNVPRRDCRIWYKHLQSHSKKLQGDVMEVRKSIEQHNKRSGRHATFLVASKMFQYASCKPFGEYLRAWTAVTDTIVILEAVSWKWMDVIEAIGETKDCLGKALMAQSASASPQSLMALLSDFRKTFNLNISVLDLTDKLALRNNWWTKECHGRIDAYVFASVDAALQQDEWTPRDGISVDAISEEHVEAALDRMLSEGRLADVPKCKGITTTSIYFTSLHVKRMIDEYQDQLVPAWKDIRLPDTLTTEQRTVAQRVSDGNRITLVTAPAGTGKTYTAAAIVEQRPGRCMCLAPTWKAIAVLREKLPAVDIEFMTVQGFVHREVAPDMDLVVVDETSMLTMWHIMCILRSYIHAETRLLFLGDDMQLPCIGRGFPIRDIQLSMPRFQLTASLRTDGQGLLAAANAARVGDDIQPVAGEVTSHPCSDPLQHVRRTHTFDIPRPPWHADFVQFITPQNNHVQKLNALVQEALHPVPGQEFSKCYVGDAVRITENAADYKNGDEGILAGLVSCGMKKRPRAREEWEGIVEFRSGVRVRVKNNHIVPAYATTVHKVQGSEYPGVVFVLFNSVHPNLKTREMLYTSVTRAKRRLELVGNVRSDDFPPLQRRTIFQHL